MEKVKYIISDLGGVVLETDFTRFAEAVKKASGRNDSDLDDRLQRFMDMDFYKLFALGKIKSFNFYAYASSYLKCYFEYDVFVKLWNEIIVKPNKKYCDFLQKAKNAGYTLILLSNIDEIHWKYSSEICKELKLFDWIYLSCDRGFIKPDLLFFTYLCLQFEIKGSEAVFIDDKKENILSAQKLKINTLLYDSAKHKEFIKAARVFLPKIFE